MHLAPCTHRRTHDSRYATTPPPLSHTKIIATIGPASDERIGDLIEAGMSVARINLSHGSEEDFLRRVARIRREADARIARDRDPDGHLRPE